MRKHRRSITIVNNEIDYDKLTKAIVDANVQKNVEENNKSNSEERLTFCGFFKLLYYIIFNKY